MGTASKELIDCPGCGTLLSPMLKECPACHKLLRLSFERAFKAPQVSLKLNMSIPWVPIGIALALVYFWASPYLTLWNLKTAMQEKDATTLAAAINFDRVREGFKEKVNTDIVESVNTETSGMELVGSFFATGLADKAIDIMVTKTNFKTLVTTGDGDGNIKGDVTTDYISWNKFNVSLGKDGGTLNMERDGLGWQIVGFDGELPKTNSANGLGIISGYTDRAYQSDAKAHLHNIYLACKAFWTDKGTRADCTVKSVRNSDYGFRLGADMHLTIINSSESGFEAQAKHSKSSKTYTIDAGGNIS